MERADQTTAQCCDVLRRGIDLRKDERSWRCVEKPELDSAVVVVNAGRRRRTEMMNEWIQRRFRDFPLLFRQRD